jgi:hypothetical protein
VQAIALSENANEKSSGIGDNISPGMNRDPVTISKALARLRLLPAS